MAANFQKIELFLNESKFIAIVRITKRIMVSPQISDNLTSLFLVFLFNIPALILWQRKTAHDLNIMHELWGVSSYRRRNKFLSVASIEILINELDDETEHTEKAALKARIETLYERYDELAKKYHKEKGEDHSCPGRGKIVFD